jgi:hypothetical protein
MVSKKTPMPKGRVCEKEGCTTILSRYNRGKICWPCYETLPLLQRPYSVADWCKK